VLCVDMDPQANLTVGLGINLRTVEKSMAEVLTGPDVTLEEIVLPTQTNGHRRGAHDDRPVGHGERPVHAIGREQALRDALQGWAESPYDYVIIDCPPTLGLLTINGLVAADGVIIPGPDAVLRAQGLHRAGQRDQPDPLKGLNPDLRILGLLPTFFDGRTMLGPRHAAGDARARATTTSSRT
jgi:chromosome partitioning protein